MTSGLGWGRKKILDMVIETNFNVKPNTIKYSYDDMLFILDELLTQEGLNYIKRGITKQGHEIFRYFVKYLLHRNIANYDSMILLTSLKGCLDENTKIKTKKYGNISLKELVEIKKDLMPEIFSLDIKNRKKINSYGFILDSGLQDCYELELESGKKVICTEKHPFFIEDKDKKIKKIKLKKLKKGDNIILLK